MKFGFGQSILDSYMRGQQGKKDDERYNSQMDMQMKQFLENQRQFGEQMGARKTEFDSNAGYRDKSLTQNWDLANLNSKMQKYGIDTSAASSKYGTDVSAASSKYGVDAGAGERKARIGLMNKQLENEKWFTDPATGNMSTDRTPGAVPSSMIQGYTAYKTYADAKTKRESFKGEVGNPTPLGLGDNTMTNHTKGFGMMPPLLGGSSIMGFGMPFPLPNTTTAKDTTQLNSAKKLLKQIYKDPQTALSDPDIAKRFQMEVLPYLMDVSGKGVSLGEESQSMLDYFLKAQSQNGGGK
ncbi:MAG: hypothetical protein KKA84_12170 [Bacteroidetes bacterium]|nr:hypothetical protein [Bacteroidota bacterium]